MEKTIIKTAEKTHCNVGWTWTLFFSAGIATAALLLLMHMHLIIIQSMTT
jgi:hypothetical protein